MSFAKALSRSADPYDCVATPVFFKQQFLNLIPLPHGHGSFLPTVLTASPPLSTFKFLAQKRKKHLVQIIKQIKNVLYPILPRFTQKPHLIQLPLAIDSLLDN
jgi:hypothetical protein